MPVIGVIGRKGGSGKTTIAVHLAAVFATQGKNVAVVDADTQGSATYWAEPGNLPMPVLHHPLEHAREIQAWSHIDLGVRGRGPNWHRGGAFPGRVSHRGLGTRKARTRQTLKPIGVMPS